MQTDHPERATDPRAPAGAQERWHRRDWHDYSSDAKRGYKGVECRKCDCEAFEIASHDEAAAPAALDAEWICDLANLAAPRWERVRRVREYINRTAPAPQPQDDRAKLVDYRAAVEIFAVALHNEDMAKESDWVDLSKWEKDCLLVRARNLLDGALLSAPAEATDATARLHGTECSRAPTHRAEATEPSMVAAEPSMATERPAQGEEEPDAWMVERKKDYEWRWVGASQYEDEAERFAQDERRCGYPARVVPLYRRAERAEPVGASPTVEAARNILNFHIIKAEVMRGASLLSMADLKILRRAFTRQQEADAQGEDRAE